MQQVVKFGSQRFHAIQRLELLSAWLSGIETYPYPVPQIKGVFECEGSRMLLNYWMYLSVARPNSQTKGRFRKVEVALEAAKQNAESFGVKFICNNTSRRLQSFYSHQGFGAVQVVEDAEMLELLKRFGGLLKNSHQEFELQDVTIEEFREFGIPELLEVNRTCLRACDKVRANALELGLREPLGAIETVRRYLNACSTVGRNAEKKEFVEFGLESIENSISEVNGLVDNCRHLGPPIRPRKSNVDNFPKDMHHSSTIRENSSRVSNYSNGDLKVQLYSNKQEAPYVVDITGEADLDEYVNPTDCDAVIGWEKCEVWLSRRYRQKEVVFHLEFDESGQLFLHVEYAGTDLREALDVRNRLIANGIKDVNRRFIEGYGQPADTLSLIGPEV